MVKDHNCLLKIQNNSGMDMRFCRSWFDTGRVGDGFDWPRVIKNGGHSEILCYERDWALTGSSGLVTFEMDTTEVTIAFSNPLIGCNKLNVGTTGRGVWDDMTDHDYKSFNVNLEVSDKRLIVHCRCTGGGTNNCTVEIQPQPYP